MYSVRRGTMRLPARVWTEVPGVGSLQRLTEIPPNCIILELRHTFGGSDGLYGTGRSAPNGRHAE
jgi:hypothetical protein